MLRPILTLLSIVKINLKRLQRQVSAVSSVSAHLTVIVDELNTLIGHRIQSGEFWTVGIKNQIKEKYGAEALTQAETNPAFHLGQSLLRDIDKVAAAKSQQLSILGARNQEEQTTRDFYTRLMILRLQNLLGLHLKADVRFDGDPPRATSSLLPSYIDADAIRVKHSSTASPALHLRF